MKRSRRGSRPHPDVSVGSVLLVLCSVVFWQTTTFREVPAMLSQNVPPTFFPRLVLSALALMSAALIVRGVTRGVEPDAREGLSRDVVRTAAAMSIAVALIPMLGAFVTFALASVGLPLLWGERRASRIVPLAVALPSTIYAIFVIGLGMRFPTGFLF